MDKKSPSAANRRNLYWRPTLDVKLEAIARELSKQGAVGLFQSSGEINRTAIIEHLVNEKLNAIGIKVED